jgi:hypothetical protein
MNPATCDERRRFYDVIVDADVRQGAIVRDRMVPGLMDAERGLAGGLLFGVTSLLLLEERFARHLDAWSRDYTSLVPWGTRLRMQVPKSSPCAARSSSELPHRGDHSEIASAAGTAEVRV